MAIVQDKVDEIGEQFRIETLISNLEKDWSEIDPDVLKNLVSDMPNRVKLIIEHEGDHIHK